MCCKEIIKQKKPPQKEMTNDESKKESDLVFN